MGAKLETLKNNWLINSSCELSQLISELTGRVPPGSNKKIYEKWIFAKYLEDIAMVLGSEDYPLEIVCCSGKNDPPDFIVKGRRFEYGVEVTEAVRQNYRREEAVKLKDAPPGTMWEVLDDTGTIRVLKQKDKLIGRGWYGSEPEQQNAELLLKAIERKHEKLPAMRKNRPSLEYHLAVYLIPLMPSRDRIVTFNLLKSKLCNAYEDLFDKIIVVDESLDKRYRSVFCRSGNRYETKSTRRAFE